MSEYPALVCRLCGYQGDAHEVGEGDCYERTIARLVARTIARLVALEREREEDRQAIRDVLAWEGSHLHGWQHWRTKHAAAIARATP
jgi:hypothetical protein